MDKQQVLELARQAGFDVSGDYALVEGYTCNDELAAFAELVAKAEREACAQLCVAIGEGEVKDAGTANLRLAANICAAAIRNRE